MIFNIIKKIIFIFVFTFISNSYGNEDNSNRIELLVNENAITKYDIVQRMKINSILKKVEIDENNYNQLINAVIDDLILEILKNKKINEFNINFDKDEFEIHEERFYSSIEYGKEDLKEIFLINNINYNYLVEFMETDLKWKKLIYGLYFRVTSVTKQEITDLISKNPDISEEMANDIILQKQLELKSQKLLKDLRDEATIEYK
tara:strand:- start:65 stop:676 length:612 start_codon:yes stop_codon:yes gene_type:complete